MTAPAHTDLREEIRRKVYGASGNVLMGHFTRSEMSQDIADALIAGPLAPILADVEKWRKATFDREADKNAAKGRARIAEYQRDEANRKLDAVREYIDRDIAPGGWAVAAHDLRRILDAATPAAPEQTDSKCWRHDYNHREYVCTCNPPVEGDTGREPTDCEHLIAPGAGECACGAELTDRGDHSG